MAKTLSGSTKVQSDYKYENADDFSDGNVTGNIPPKDEATWEKKITWTNGTGNNQVERMIRKRVSLSASPATDDTDLRSATDEFGDTITFTEVRELTIHNVSTTENDKILVGGAGSGNNGWGQLFDGDQDAQTRVGPEGTLHRNEPRQGIKVTNGSSVLRLENTSTNTINVDLIVRGLVS